jgi:tetratricopeptide (TPR) repeat protein
MTRRSTANHIQGQASPSLARKLPEAHALHQAGHADKAERLYSEVLRHRPNEFDALHLLGLLNYQRGRLPEALRLIGAALECNGRSGDAWSNLGANAIDARRSMSLQHFAPLAGLARYPVLQPGKAAPSVEARQPPDNLPLIDFSGDLHGFDDTAALIANLDLVICVDTAVAHLTGALGKPVWALSRFDACWRWLEGRDDSPWYPTARLFR